MIEHTPGPWHQSHRKTDNGNYSTQVYDKAGETICTLSWFPVPIGFTVETRREANAHLIAAAPDMLAELRDILDWARASRVPLREPEIKSIQAVIAKAEGTAL